jgi:hypothetical protein
MTWTRKKRRRKARKAAKAQRPLSFSDEAKAATLALLTELEVAALNSPELEDIIPVPDDDGPSGLHDVDLGSS